MKKKIGRGGKRAGAGRPAIPKSEKKIMCWLMVRADEVKVLGGRERVQELFRGAVERGLKNVIRK